MCISVSLICHDIRQQGLVFFSSYYQMWGFYHAVYLSLFRMWWLNKHIIWSCWSSLYACNQVSALTCSLYVCVCLFQTPYSLSDSNSLQMWLDVSRTHQSVKIRQLPWSSGLQPNESVCGGKQHQVTLPTTQLPLCSRLQLPAESESSGIDACVPPAEALCTAAGLRSSHESVTVRAAILQTPSPLSTFVCLWSSPAPRGIMSVLDHFTHHNLHPMTRFCASGRRKVRVWRLWWSLSDFYAGELSLTLIICFGFVTLTVSFFVYLYFFWVFLKMGNFTFT